MAAKPKPDATPSFDRFWSFYGRKEAKLDAVKAWHQMACEDIADQIIGSVQKQFRTRYKNVERKFIPLPASWLRAGRWDDEVAPPESAVQPLARPEPEPAVVLPMYMASLNLVMFRHMAKWFASGVVLSDEDRARMTARLVAKKKEVQRYLEVKSIQPKDTGPIIELFRDRMNEILAEYG